MLKKLISIFLFLLITTSFAFANPPSSITVNYDSNYNQLLIEIAHPVLDSTKHYVNRVDVELNGKDIYDKTFDQQTDRDSMTVSPIQVKAKPGDVFQITAYCNNGGSKTVSYTVQKDSRE